MDERTRRETVVADSGNIYGAIRYYLGRDDISNEEINKIVSYMVVHLMQDMGAKVDFYEYNIDGDRLKYKLLTEIPGLLDMFKRSMRFNEIQNVEVDITYGGLSVSVC